MTTTRRTNEGGIEIIMLNQEQIEEAARASSTGLVVGTVNKKMTLREKIGRLFGREAQQVTSAAPDERTTDTSVQGVALSAGGWSNQYYEQTKLENRRQARYKDYERMYNESTVMHRAIKVTTNNVFMSRSGDDESYLIKEGEEGKADPKVIKVVKDTDARLDMPAMMPEMYRGCLKAGDAFEEMVFDDNNVITRLKWLDPKKMHRNEDEYGRIQADAAYSMKDDAGESVAGFKFWQVVHLRHAHERGNLYGTSFLFSARRPFKILSVMEDGVAIMRLVRASDRMVFYVPVPKNATPDQKRLIVEQAKQQFSRSLSVDSSGKIDITKNPLADDEDIFVGLEDGSNARVEKLGGSGVIGQLADVEYFQNLMVMATGVPKAYLGLERDVNAKATLSWQDIEFARQIRACQRECAWFQRQIYDRQLIALGMVPMNEAYEIEYPGISFVDEEMRASVLNVMWGVAVAAKSFGAPTEWVLEHILRLSQDQIHQFVNSPGYDPAAKPQLPGQQMPKDSSKQGELDRIKEAVFGNMRLQAQLNEVRDMISVAIPLSKGAAF